MKKRVSLRAILKLEQTGFTEISLSIIHGVKALRTIFFFLTCFFLLKSKKGKRHGKLLDRVGINVKFIFWFEDNTHYKYRPLDNQVTYRPKNFFCERVLRRIKETLSIFSSKTEIHTTLGFMHWTASQCT